MGVPGQPLSIGEKWGNQPQWAHKILSGPRLSPKLFSVEMLYLLCSYSFFEHSGLLGLP